MPNSCANPNIEEEIQIQIYMKLCIFKQNHKKQENVNKFINSVESLKGLYANF